MKLSELSRDDLPALPDDAKTRIVFGGTYPTGGNSIAALLLGCGTAMEMTERALAAAALFKAGRTSRIFPEPHASWATFRKAPEEIPSTGPATSSGR